MDLHEVDWTNEPPSDPVLSALLWDTAVSQSEMTSESAVALAALRMLNNADEEVNNLINGGKGFKENKLVDYEQISKPEVAELLNCTPKYLDTLVEEGWLNPPVQRRPGGTWYYAKTNVLEYKLGKTHERYLRDLNSKRFDNAPSDAQKGLAPHKLTKRPSNRKPPKTK